jgi:endonuclease-3
VQLVVKSLRFDSKIYKMPKTDWAKAIQPLIKKYKGKPHPLEYKNLYQLVVMVVLSAQDSDKNINSLAPELFHAFPDMATLSSGSADTLLPFVKKVRGHRKKIEWLLSIAREVKSDKNIPLTMSELVRLKGIGRKSANVIMREAGVKAEGVVVDLHVVRVAPRLGIAKATDPKKIEEEIMRQVPEKDWGEVGMAISFLGRETCRPSHPEHHECVMSPVCEYFHEQKKTKPAAASSKRLPAKKTGTTKKLLKKKVLKQTSLKKSKKKTA